MSKQWLKENQLEIRDLTGAAVGKVECVYSLDQYMYACPQMIYRLIDLNVWPQSGSLGCRWTLRKAPPVHLCLHRLIVKLKSLSKRRAALLSVAITVRFSPQYL